eukprot:gene24384-30725_t
MSHSTGQSGGVAGCSLIEKVAKLRGEVTALRRELDDKQNFLIHVEEDKSQLDNQHNELQTQLISVQQRLAQTESDTFRLRNSDIGKSIKLVEAERDTLQLYVDNDMQKSVQLAKQVEHLESTLRMAHQAEATAVEQATRLAEALETQSKRAIRLEEELAAEAARVREVTQTNASLQLDKDSVHRQLERKTLEAEELNKMHMTSFVQLREREDELLNKNDTLNSLRSRLQEAEATLPHVQTENRNLRERLSFAEHELSATRDSLSTVEPRLGRIEPEWTRLRAERDAWHAEKMDMLNELVRLRPLERQLGDIGRDLSETVLTPLSDQDENNLTDSSSSQTLHTPAKRVSSAGTDLMSLSQQHSMWIGLPSVRNLHPVLYERIRSLATDLNRQELLGAKLQSALGITEQQLQRIEKDNVSLLSQLSQSQEGSISTIRALTQRAKVAEEEVSDNQTARITLDQVRVMLRSYPGSVGDLYPGDASVERSRYTSEHFINSLTDSQLPDFIGRVVQHNSSAVIGLSESNNKISQLQLDFNALSIKFAALVKEHKVVEDDLALKTEKLMAAQNRLRGVDAEQQKLMDEAGDFAEKQNTTIRNLQANIDRATRTAHLKDAQIKTQTDQLNATCKGLYELACDHSESTRSRMPSESAAIPELLEFFADALHLPSRLHRRGEGDVLQSMASSNRHHRQDDLRESMLASSSNPHHVNYAHYGSRAAPAAWVSPEKFVHHYSSSGGSGDTNRRPESARKKKPSGGGSPASSGGEKGDRSRRSNSKDDQSSPVSNKERNHKRDTRSLSRSPPIVGVKRHEGASQKNQDETYDRRRGEAPRSPPSSQQQQTSGRSLSYSSSNSNSEQRHKLEERSRRAAESLKAFNMLRE